MTLPNAHSLRESTNAIFRRFAEVQRRRQTFKQVGAMDDHMLEDIGLSRDVVINELGYNPRTVQL